MKDKNEVLIGIGCLLLILLGNLLWWPTIIALVALVLKKIFGI